MPLVNPGGNQPVYLAPPGTPTDPMTFEVAPGPGLVPDTPFNFLTNSSGYPVRVDNTSVPAYVGTGNGTSPPEQFTAYHPGAINSTEPLQPGDTTILRNVVRNTAVATAAALRIIGLTECSCMCAPPSLFNTPSQGHCMHAAHQPEARHAPCTRPRS
jgi:hypothetical protein